MKKETSLRDLYETLVDGSSIITFFLGLLDILVPYGTIQLWSYFKDLSILRTSTFKYVSLAAIIFIMTYLSLYLLIITASMFSFIVIDGVSYYKEERMKKIVNAKLLETKKLIQEMVEKKKFEPAIIFSIGMTCARDLCSNKKRCSRFQEIPYLNL